MRVSNDQPVIQPTQSTLYRSQNQAVTSRENSPKDIVSLSPQAQRVLNGQMEGQVFDATKVPPGAPEGTLPLIKYAVPEWYAEYGFEVSGKIGARGDWFAQNNPAAASASKEERNEYSSLIQKHYRDVLDSHGINGTEAHYQATIADKNSSETLRQDMADRVRSDGRLMELMHRMGKADILADPTLHLRNNL